MTKKYDVYLTKSAQVDIEQIFDYISDDSLTNAVSFISEIEQKVFSLENHPNRNPLIPENEFFEASYRHLIYKKYRIIYRISESSVFVLRIVHGAQLLKL